MMKLHDEITSLYISLLPGAMFEVWLIGPWGYRNDFVRKFQAHYYE